MALLTRNDSGPKEGLSLTPLKKQNRSHTRTEWGKKKSVSFLSPISDQWLIFEMSSHIA